MDRLELAKHEVGHALVAHLVGFDVVAIELDAGGGSAFVTGPGDLLEKGMDVSSVAIRCGIVAVAGEAASQIGMSADDTDDLRRAIWLGQLGDFYDVRTASFDLARKRLAGREDAIERIADALVQRGCLSGAEFRALIDAEGAQ